MPARPARRQFQCPACGRRVELTPDDLRRFTGRPWPACCGRAMDLTVGAARVSPSDGTDPERPALRPRR